MEPTHFRGGVRQIATNLVSPSPYIAPKCTIDYWICSPNLKYGLPLKCVRSPLCSSRKQGTINKITPLCNLETMGVASFPLRQPCEELYHGFSQKKRESWWRKGKLDQKAESKSWEPFPNPLNGSDCFLKCCGFSIPARPSHLFQAPNCSKLQGLKGMRKGQ